MQALFSVESRQCLEGRNGAWEKLVRASIISVASGTPFMLN